MNIKDKNQSAINALIKVVSKLRDPKSGCPWDLEQTHGSLGKFVLEEAYEVTEAIREENYENLCEELGDLLLQVILHSQIASESKIFNFNDVAANITRKLIRRHPHVFTQKKDYQNKNISEIWNEVKALENPLDSSNTPLSDKIRRKIRPQPALFGAEYISNKYESIGFKWNNIDEIWEKFKEEINEFKDSIVNQDVENSKEELGDVMFTLINIASWYNLNIEESLEKTNKKVLERLSYIESKLDNNLESVSKIELQKYWNEAKHSIKNKEIKKNQH